MHGENETRLLWIHFQLLPKVNDVGINCARVGVIIISPHRIQQTISAECFRRMGDEVRQQGKLFCRKFDRLARARYFITADVDFDIAESINVRMRRQWRSASQHCFHACHEFANGERFGDVIICP